MNTWGNGLFENDVTFESIREIEFILAFPIYNFHNDNQKATAKRVLDRSRISATLDQLSIDTTPDICVIFIACCMLLGVRIYKKDLNQAGKYVRDLIAQGSHHTFTMFGPVAQAMKDYKNDGVTVWDPDMGRQT